MQSPVRLLRQGAAGGSSKGAAKARGRPAKRLKKIDLDDSESERSGEASPRQEDPQSPSHQG